MEVTAAAPHHGRHGVTGPSYEQAIGFLPHRGAHVAYAVTGDGPPLLLDFGCLHHLEILWRRAAYRHVVQRLSRWFTVVRWDRPGFGMSDRRPSDLSAEAEEALVERLVRQTGGASVAIVAAGDACPSMIEFAARHPERVSRLALFAPVAGGASPLRGLSASTLELLAGASAIHDAVAAVLSAGSEPDLCPWLASALERSADVATMVGVVARPARGRRDCGAERLRMPAMVLHRTGDPVVAVSSARALAGRITGARFVPLDGGSHLLYAGDPEPVLSTLLPFLLEGRPGDMRPLSLREMEVARMVARGLTNAEIGHHLAIRRRTVDAHLEHIRAKLGMRSRSRIAAWVASGVAAGIARSGM